MKDTGPSPEWELTDIETCESYNQDNGCPYMAECGIYQNRKKVERLQNLAQKEGVQNENPP
jgi:Rad3-related DNA helicase